MFADPVHAPQECSADKEYYRRHFISGRCDSGSSTASNADKYADGPSAEIEDFNPGADVGKGSDPWKGSDSGVPVGTGILVAL